VVLRVSGGVRVFVDQAVEDGFRRIRSMPESVAVTRGAWHSLPGTRCAMPWCGRALLLCAWYSGQDGAQMRLTENYMTWKNSADRLGASVRA
jgi:hypothetical protein